ncbi:MAG: hypothetical protein AB7O74_08765 [Candidatus Nanopelagicales bacterium]
MSIGQVRPLFALRWRMIRSRTVQSGLAVLGLVALGLVVLGVVAGASSRLGRQTASDIGLGDLGGAVDRTGEVAALLPSAMLAFALLCIVAPLAAGGGQELIPESQLVAYPVRIATLVRIGFLLSPLNIAWYLQVLLLTAATGYAVRGEGGPLPPVGVLVAYMIACTAAGQAIGWAVVGVRRTRGGRRATWLVAAALVGVAAWIIFTDRGTEFLDSSPTLTVLGAQIQAAALTRGWIPVVLWCLAITVAGYLVAVRVAGWALRRPGDLGVDGPLARPVDRRPFESAPTAYRMLVRMDRASLWRSPPLRRGLLVLGVLPVAAAALASLPWSSIALLPPLVASGSALLFGVNAMCLDGSGSIWVSTLPHDPDVVLRSKAQVVAEVVSVPVLLVLVGAGLRSSRAPDLVDLASTLGAAVSCTALVVATALHLSVTRPHRADLRGPRDTPAPPGTMAVYSVRLAVVTTTVGLVFSGLTFGRSILPPLLMTTGLLCWAAWSWTRTRRRWSDPAVRAHVVTTVAAG